MNSGCHAAVQVLEQHPVLESFRLCMSSAVTDRTLEALPAGSMLSLCLVACEAVHGHSISRLRKLETLRLSSCNCFSQEAVQVGCVAWFLHAASLALPFM